MPSSRSRRPGASQPAAPAASPATTTPSNTVFTPAASPPQTPPASTTSPSMPSPTRSSSSASHLPRRRKIRPHQPLEQSMDHLRLVTFALTCLARLMRTQTYIGINPPLKPNSKAARSGDPLKSIAKCPAGPPAKPRPHSLPLKIYSPAVFPSGFC